MVALWIATASAQTVTVQPFLQSVTPEGAWVVWEAEGAVGGEVRWGDSATSLTQSATATAQPVEDGAVILQAELSRLTPGSRVFYEVQTGEIRSEVADFLVPATPSEMGDFRLLAMSDMQRNGLWPDKFREVVHDGVLGWLTSRGETDLAASFDMILIPGDLVDDGPDHAQWRDTFFAPLFPLSAHVPIWPVYGNHEDGTHWFTDYFHLPDNGDPVWSEHWWAQRHGNVDVIGLDSNLFAQWADQMSFLQARLDAACFDNGVDFVIAQLHHPFQSELWTPGNNPLTGQLVERMSAFSDACGKPTVHLFGHTHAYSRGQTRDHAHLMVNVATAGGAIDRWGEQTQQDYAAFSVSDDDWGFVVVDVTRGINPKLTVRRWTRGDAQTPRDNDLTDVVTLRRYNTAPATPVLYPPDGDRPPGDCVSLGASAFVDLDGDAQQASHWQVSDDCANFESPDRDVWRQDRNLYFGVDTQAGDDLRDEAVEDLPAGAWCARVRVRDAALAWSTWSAPVAFDVSTPRRSVNLLPDPSFEDELDGWVRTGHVEVTGDGRCGGALPADGARAVGLGGPCVAQPGGGVSVRASLQPAADLVAAGAPLRWSVQAMQGLTTLTWAFEDAAGVVVATVSDTVGGDVTWEAFAGTHAVPAGAVTFTLTVTADEPVQLDAFEARVGEEPLACARPAWPSAVAAQDRCGCDASRGGAGASAVAVLALVGSVRRRVGRREGTR